MLVSALIKVGEVPRRIISFGVLVHGNPLLIVLPPSSNYDERPITRVYSTAAAESLPVMSDVNIEDVYLAGYSKSKSDSEDDPSCLTSSVVDGESSPPNKRTPSARFQQR